MEVAEKIKTQPIPKLIWALSLVVVECTKHSYRRYIRS